MMGREVFQVLEPGILTTVQDLGRYGFGQWGVPLSGAADPFSFRVGNLLVGNREEEASLEITVMGLRLKALRDAVIAVTGGDLGATLNGESLEMWRTHVVVEGDILAFKGVRSGCRAYLAVQGGIDAPLVMGSRSTYLSGKFGGFEGRALRTGDVLCSQDVPPSLDRLGRRFPGDWIPRFGKGSCIRVVRGPQDHHFTDRGLETFQSSAYQVTPQCDRVGIRLEGPGIEKRSDVEESIISEGLLPGAIQVPGDGRPMIVLGEIVTGGYTKIATVISIDLSKVGQLKPGDLVRFEPTSVEEAQDALREQEEWLRKFKRQEHQPERR